MACDRKERTGYCNHSQCPYPDETGYECVDIVNGFCEVGEGCLEKCKYSYKPYKDKDAKENYMTQREELLERAKQEFSLMESDEIKRATRYFKIIKRRFIGGTSDYYDLALKALEREIPQKPKEIDEDYSYFVCPICDFTVGYSDEKETHKYCLNCGQRIDWS